TQMEGLMTKTMPPLHAGDVLCDEFIEPMGSTTYGLAQSLNIPRTRIERVVREETAITADTAHRPGRYFRTTPQFWLNLQSEYDLRVAAAGLGRQLEKIQPHHEHS